MAENQEREGRPYSLNNGDFLGLFDRESTLFGEQKGEISITVFGTTHRRSRTGSFWFVVAVIVASKAKFKEIQKPGGPRQQNLTLLPAMTYEYVRTLQPVNSTVRYSTVGTS